MGLRLEYKCKYDELTPCTTSDAEIVSASDDDLPIKPTDYPGIPSQQLSDLLNKLTHEELKSQDFTYEDMPDLVSCVKKKPFITKTTTTTTDEDTDAEYNEYPFNSNTSRSNN